MFTIPLSRKSIVVLKSVALKSMKERAASGFYPGSGMLEGVGDASFGPFFFVFFFSWRGRLCYLSLLLHFRAQNWQQVFLLMMCIYYFEMIIECHWVINTSNNMNSNLLMKP